MTDHEGISLKSYLEAKIETLALTTEARIEAHERSQDKAETALDKRLEGMNEFRKQLSDQVHTFLPRTEYNVRHEAVLLQLDEIRAKADKEQGIALGRSRILAIIGSIGLGLVGLLSAVLHFLR